MAAGFVHDFHIIHCSLWSWYDQDFLTVLGEWHLKCKTKIWHMIISVSRLLLSPDYWKPKKSLKNQKLPQNSNLGLPYRYFRVANHLYERTKEWALVIGLSIMNLKENILLTTQIQLQDQRYKIKRKKKIFILYYNKKSLIVCM